MVLPRRLQRAGVISRRNCCKSRIECLAWTRSIQRQRSRLIIHLPEDAARHVRRRCRFLCDRNADSEAERLGNGRQPRQYAAVVLPGGNDGFESARLAPSRRVTPASSSEAFLQRCDRPATKSWRPSGRSSGKGEDCVEGSGPGEVVGLEPTPRVRPGGHGPSAWTLAPQSRFGVCHFFP
jgi:hypothetical protein